MLNHASHDHPATSAARAACRKALAASQDTTKAERLIMVMDQGFSLRPGQWLYLAARRFAGYQGQDDMEAAKAVLAYFAPSGDEVKDQGRIRNGYIITEDPYTIRSITLRSAS